MTHRQNNYASRAGMYRQQPGGYRAFIPAPLPPNPSITITGELQVVLSQADRALGRLDGIMQMLPDPDLFVPMYVRKEAVLSSQIEGVQSTLPDLLAAEEGVSTLRRTSDVDELVNYVAAMNHGLERLKELPISIRLIREIHSRLLQGARGAHLMPGELRKSQNWIGPFGRTLQEASFVPPPPHQVAEDMSHLERFIHADTDLPLLVKIGLVHAQFEMIHPFLDGNGRVGRLLITFMLCERKVLAKPVLYLSWYFKQHRQQYYDGLNAVHNAGAWEQWLVFFLRGVEVVSKQAADTARKILALREKHRRVITDNFGRAAANGYRVLDHIYERPIISVSEAQKVMGTTYVPANKLVARMVDCGILRKIAQRTRYRSFAYQEYIDLFHDTESVVTS